VTTGSNNYFPKNAPKIIQNAFYGPNSIFPIFPWFGFIFFGGVVGVFLNKNKEKIRNIGFILRMLSLGIAFCLLAYLIITILGSIYPDNQIFGNGYWYFMQLAIILVVLTVMLLFDQKTKIKLPFLLAIGQNTLTVYIVHVIVLYGAIFGIGIKTYLSKSLTFGESIIGAVFFILLFGCLTKLQSTLGVKIKRIFSRQNTSI
jgi:surface polysaccharide O-acyltransferase-like enzyme